MGDQESALRFARLAAGNLYPMTEPWNIAYDRWILARVLISVNELNEASAMLDETRLPARLRERCMVEHALVTANAELMLARGDPEGARRAINVTLGPIVGLTAPVLRPIEAALERWREADGLAFDYEGD